MVQANSSTPAADSSLSTSISKRVRDEPYGPSSAPPTMTTNSDGSTSRSAHTGGAAGLKPRGGQGNAATFPRFPRRSASASSPSSSAFPPSSPQPLAATSA